VEKGEKPLAIPFWALSFEELIKLSLGKLDDRQAAIVSDAVVALKRQAIANQPREGLLADRLTADSPVPFSIHKLWLDFHQREHRTVISKPGAAADEVEPAYVQGQDGNTPSISAEAGK
jgi:hypothetical protein